LLVTVTRGSTCLFRLPRGLFLEMSMWLVPSPASYLCTTLTTVRPLKLWIQHLLHSIPPPPHWCWGRWAAWMHGLMLRGPFTWFNFLLLPPWKY
jgi:hypothetical protein